MNKKFLTLVGFNSTNLKEIDRKSIVVILFQIVI
jgi:hypothetical protein